MDDGDSLSDDGCLFSCFLLFFFGLLWVILIFLVFLIIGGGVT